MTKFSKIILILSVLLLTGFFSYAQDCETVLTVDHTGNSSTYDKLYFYDCDNNLIDTCVCNDAGHSGYFNCTQDGCLQGIGPYCFVRVGECYYDSTGDVQYPPLPVELIYFRGRLDHPTWRNNSYFLLEWETASETNNDRFLLQKSRSGITFTNIATIKGAGTSNALQQYSYNDNEIGDYYYRLKQIDYDGQYEYSNIIFLRSDIHVNLKVYSALNEIVIRNVTQPIKVDVYSPTAQRIYSELIYGDKKIYLNINSSATYFVRVDNKSDVYKVFLHKYPYGGEYLDLNDVELDADTINIK